MSSIEKDPRFSRVLTDPRFLPMPTYEKKVKIDKRFNALFTSKDFGHRALLDKRGRPIHDVSKRGKHVMEQFYQLSSDDSSSDDDEDGDGQSKVKSAAKHTVKEPKDVDVGEAELGENKRKMKELSVLKSKKDKAVQFTRHKQHHEDRSDDDISSSSDNVEVKKSRKRKNNLDQRQGEDNAAEEPLTKKTKKGQKFKTKQKSSEKKDEDIVKKTLKSPSVKQMTKDKKAMTKESESDYNSSENDKDTEDEDESSESDDSSEEEELPEYTADFDLQDTMVEHKWNELHTDAPSVVESTHRLAVCNMDWDFVKAQDLFVLFKSFAGEGGAVHSVTIYPSEFGKERMAEEVVLGPREMRENLKDGNEDGEKGVSETNKKKKKGKQRILDQQKLKRMEKQMVKAEHEVLREYQLNRMRYYYAVVDCNCAEAADNIYKECDGQEYQLSSVKLDLRFIPDDMTFDDEPKELFTDEQGLVDYTPRLFNSTALSQAKVEVTWDETEFDRLHKKMVHLQHKELENIVEENKYADIIAPPESDSDLDDDDGRPQWLKSVLAEGDEEDEDISEEKKISMYRKVIMDKLMEEEEKEKRENRVDKELEWQPGLKSEVANKLKKKEKKEVTIVDGYLEKKREKKKKKREQKGLAKKAEEDNDDENMLDDDDVPGIIDNQLKEMMESEGVDLDTMKGKQKKEKRKKPLEEEEEDEREKAELELLLMGDGDEKKVGKPEKVEEGKLSRRQKTKKALLAKEQKKKEAEELTIDVDDPRFGAMFTSHHFHIDPNAPEFKKTQNMMKLVDEQIKRKSKGKREKNQEEEGDSRTVSKKLLESLKRKMKK